MTSTADEVSVPSHQKHLSHASIESPRVPRHGQKRCFQVAGQTPTVFFETQHTRTDLESMTCRCQFSVSFFCCSQRQSHLLTTIEHLTQRWSSAAPRARSTGMGNATSFYFFDPKCVMEHMIDTRCALSLTATCTRTGTTCSTATSPSTFIAAINLSPLSLHGSGSHAPTKGSSPHIRAIASMKTILREALSVLSFFSQH